jgi:membrane-associated protein
MTSWLHAMTDAGWLLPALFGLVALDALVPVLPSGTGVMLAGVLAASDRVGVVAVLLMAAAGAYCGDNLVYALGRRWGRRLAGGRWRGYTWIRHGLQTRPASVIIPGRFVPGARFGVMLCAGAFGCPPARFRRLSAAAALVWAATATLSGYLGGAAFEQQPLLALATGAVAGALVMTTVETAGRRLRERASAPAAPVSPAGR